MAQPKYESQPVKETNYHVDSLLDIGERPPPPDIEDKPQPVDQGNKPHQQPAEGLKQGESEGATFSHALAEQHDPNDIPDEEKVNTGKYLMSEKNDVDHDYADPEEILGSLSTEDFWMLVRRFNKQVQHVRQIDQAPPGDLDLIMSKDEEFSPEKLRANMERFYMTVAITLLGFFKHIVRLRSWNEAKRTGYFMAAYFAAWALNMLMPTIFAMLIALIVYPPSRSLLFPPAPIALVDEKTGGVKKPSAGSLGSKDSATGAPETHRGEAVEQEAYNMVSSFATVVISSATGEQPVKETEHTGEPKEGTGLDRVSAATQATDTKAAVSGMPNDPKTDKTKKPMEQAVWLKARPAMRALADVCDIWERFANLLEPTAPFPKRPRWVFGASLVPLLLISLVTPAEWFVKGSSFGFGVAFFGQPLIDRGLNYLNTHYPNWIEAIDIRNTLLLHVPTNAQLTLTLLRIGEAKNSPLPPPPRQNDPPPESGPTTPIPEEEVPMESDNAKVQEAINPDPVDKEIEEEKNKPAHPRREKIIGFFKGFTRAGVQTNLGTDQVRAAAGSKHAKHRLGVLPKKKEDIHTACEFKCRYDGKRGYAVLTTSATVPCISFSSHRNKDGLQEMKPVFSVPLNEIRGLKKVGGFGWKAKMVVGWAMEREVADSLEIFTKSGETYKLTAMPGRDELFNRLISSHGHIWETM